ncbi:MAG: DUF2207 family protein, partial [Eubacteriales bacterium]
IDGMPVRQLDEPDNENRPENTFAVEDTDEGNTVYIYFRQQGSGTRIFKISYRVENAVKIYSDVGEFFWNLTGKTGISDIGTLTATLTVPEGIPTEEFRIWAHGPLNGTFEKQSDGSAALQVDSIPLGTIVDMRCTLPADCFYGGWEQQGEGLDGILAEEKALADSANAKREEEAREKANREAWEASHPVLAPIERFCSELCRYVKSIDHYIWTVFCIYTFGSFISFFVIILPTHDKIESILRRRKQKKYRTSPTHSPRYFRDLPDDRPAPAVDRLVHFYDGKSSISRQFSATLLELNLKKLIRFQTTASDTVILLNEQEDGEHIPGYQQILWDFLWKASDASGQIAMSDLKEYIKDNQADSLGFRKSFERAVEEEFSKRVNSKNMTRYSHIKLKHRLIFSAVAGILAALIRMLSTLYAGIGIEALLESGLAVFIVVTVIEIIIHFWRLCFRVRCYILDQQGEDDLALWQAFGRFLDDFTTFDDKELPEFSVWREYMVYAVAMGNGQKVAKALAVKYPEAFTTETNSFGDDIYRWLPDTVVFDAMDSIGREVAEVREPGPSSSGDGDGGGFSDSGGGSDSGSGGDFID